MKRGRRPLSPTERTVTVSIRVVESLYDRAYRHASQTRTSVPDVLRHALEKQFVTKNNPLKH